MNFREVAYTVPAHWLSALVNGDESSFDYYDDPADYAAYQQFCKHEVLDAIISVDCDSEAFFCRDHDASVYGVLPCDVVDCTFLYPQSTQLST